MLDAARRLSPVFVPLALCGTLFCGEEPTLEELEARLLERPKDIALLIELGKRYHAVLARGKNEKVYWRGKRHLDRALFLSKKAPLPLAWAGSLRTLRARDLMTAHSGLLVGWSSPKQFGEGFGMLDQAARRAPDDLAVRLVRADNALLVPRPERLSVAVKDYELIIGKCEADPGLAKELNLPRLYFARGTAFDRMGRLLEARAMWQKAIEAGPGSEAAKRSAARLAQAPGQELEAGEGLGVDSPAPAKAGDAAGTGPPLEIDEED